MAKEIQSIPISEAKFHLFGEVNAAFGPFDAHREEAAASELSAKCGLPDGTSLEEALDWMQDHGKASGSDWDYGVKVLRDKLRKRMTNP